MAALLEPAGAQVTFACDGVEALEAATASRFDLILMDMRMPNMGGLEAARRIRQREVHSKTGRTPILAVTASAMQHEQDEYVDAGVDGIVAKPVDAERLLVAIERATGLRPAGSYPQPPESGLTTDVRP
jgi:CheY-like chemotaxis protein